MNESKINDPRFWQKWQESGAVGTALSAVTSPIKREAKPIGSIVINHKDPRGVHSTLGIGERVVNSGISNDGYPWSVLKPEVIVVVPGQDFKLGQLVKSRDLPSGTSTLNEFYGRK